MTESDQPLCDCGRSDAAQRIVQAAEALFAERGFAGVSIRDIAEAAGISKANVFHHFANKDELYKAVLEDCCLEFRQLLQSATGQKGPIEQVIGELSLGHLTHMLEHPTTIQLMLRQLLGSQREDEAALMGATVARNFSVAVEAIAGFKTQGRLGEHVDPMVMATVVFGSHLAFFLCRDLLSAAPGGEALADPARFDAAMLGLLTRGVLPIPTELKKT